MLVVDMPSPAVSNFDAGNTAPRACLAHRFSPSIAVDASGIQEASHPELAGILEACRSEEPCCTKR